MAWGTPAASASRKAFQSHSQALRFSIASKIAAKRKAPQGPVQSRWRDPPLRLLEIVALLRRRGCELFLEDSEDIDERAATILDPRHLETFDAPPTQPPLHGADRQAVG